MPKSTRRAVGVGGVFFRSRDPAKLAEWYRNHLGIKIQDGVALFSWRAFRPPHRPAQTVWALFPRDSDYFPKGQQSMVNYRVKHLERTLTRLKKEGVKVSPKSEVSEYGKFGWAFDAEGNKIELWEPPPGQKRSRLEIPAE